MRESQKERNLSELSQEVAESSKVELNIKSVANRTPTETIRGHELKTIDREIRIR